MISGLAGAESILEVTSALYYVLDRNHLIRYANPAFCRSSRKHRSELVGRCLWDIWNPEEWVILRSAYDECLANQAPREFTFHNQDTNRFFSVELQPVSGELLVGMVDITHHLNQTAEIKVKSSSFASKLWS